MDVLMPQLGETVAEGKIVKWFKSAGDAVKPGDNLFEIETDKSLDGSAGDVRRHAERGPLSGRRGGQGRRRGGGDRGRGRGGEAYIGKRSGDRAASFVRPRESGGPEPSIPGSPRARGRTG